MEARDREREEDITPGVRVRKRQLESSKLPWVLLETVVIRPLRVEGLTLVLQETWGYRTLTDQILGVTPSLRFQVDFGTTVTEFRGPRLGETHTYDRPISVREGTCRLKDGTLGLDRGSVSVREQG